MNLVWEHPGEGQESGAANASADNDVVTLQGIVS
jgi:hypothetical protein